MLSSRGACVAVADGISSSNVSQVASESAVKAFLEDYYCTSEAWSVRTSAERVLCATNSWLYAQTRKSQFRYDADRGYVCTFSGLILRGNTGHVFHAGDTRIYRIRGDRLEQLTEDHRLRVSDEVSYLSRALGASARLELDYRAVPLEPGDCFLLATDGVYEHASEGDVLAALREHAHDLDAAARCMVRRAHDGGSPDNLTAQLVRVDTLPERSATERVRELSDLPFPEPLQVGGRFEGFRIVRELYASHRSHVYLAIDEETQARVAIKIPAVDVQGDPAHVERFLMEEWIARRIHSPHVARAFPQTRPRRHAYTVTEYVEGQTLAQWMRDHAEPDVETVRGLVEQIARGLQALHRQETLHQDLRPENVLIDRQGTAMLIDFGSARVAGIAEIQGRGWQPELLGTAQYAAPEYFLGEAGTTGSDVYSLGVIAYQMLSGRLPYGARVPQARTRQAQRRLVYASVLDETREIPAWVDYALEKAVHPDPHKRYAELSELTYDLRHPSRAFLGRVGRPLIERNPVAFWKWVSFLLSVAIVILLVAR